MKTAQQIADILLASLIVELREAGADNGMCAQALYPGSLVPMDYGVESACGGNGGMAWVRLGAAFPSVEFPAVKSDINNCTSTLAYEFDMGVLRPAPIGEQFGKDVHLPTDEVHTATTHRQMEDMMIMHRAINAAAEDIELLLLGTYSPMGPQGGAVGGYWNLTAGSDF